MYSFVMKRGTLLLFSVLNTYNASEVYLLTKRSRCGGGGGGGGGGEYWPSSSGVFNGPDKE